MEAARLHRGHLHLWEIADGIQALGERIAEAEGELTPELEAEWDRLEGSLESKVENTALYIRDIETDAEKAKAEEQRIRAIRTALENQASRMKDYLQFQLARAGRDKVETPKARVRIQANSRPSIRYTGDPADLPDAFKRVRVDVDGTAAYEAWKREEELPEGFVVETGSHLRVF